MSKTGSYRVALCQVPDLPELDERRSAGCHSDKDIGAKNTYRLRGGMFIQAARHRSDSIECLPGCAAAWLGQRNSWSGHFRGAGAQSLGPGGVELEDLGQLSFSGWDSRTPPLTVYPNLVELP